MARYDIVVVGAGLGGLTAGAILTRAGRKVLIIERSNSSAAQRRATSPAICSSRARCTKPAIPMIRAIPSTTS
jgi:2-polyprenyl-6-methoxyphenol hydroxylase-like FAD-dependent oxidoreductase